jgi:hypothetical protein
MQMIACIPDDRGLECGSRGRFRRLRCGRGRGWSLGLGAGLDKRSLRHVVAEDHDIHAAVHAAAFRGEIGCDRVILGVSTSVGPGSFTYLYLPEIRYA